MTPACRSEGGEPLLTMRTMRASESATSAKEMLVGLALTNSSPCQRAVFGLPNR